MNTVIFDVSALEEGVCRADPSGDLIEYIAEAYGAQPSSVKAQINELRKCDKRIIESKIKNFIDVSDEEIVKFIVENDGLQFLDKVLNDPHDLIMIVFQIKSSAEMLISCDRRLLYLAEKLQLAHCCFKAAVKHANDKLGLDIFEEPVYRTQEMFEDGSSPFFHYKNSRYCDLCDERKRCPCHKWPWCPS